MNFTFLSDFRKKKKNLALNNKNYIDRTLMIREMNKKYFVVYV